MKKDKKFTTKFLPISLALSIMASLPGCGHREETIYEPPQDTITNENIIDEPEVQLTEEEIREQQIEESKNFINNFQTHYEQEEYLITEEEIKEILSQTTRTECHDDFTGDVYDLEEIIKNNSLEYVQNNQGYQYPFNDYQKEFNEETFFCELALTHAIDYVVNEATNDTKEDIHRLQSLKIVIGNVDESDNEKHEIVYDESGTTIFAYYDEELNIIVLSIKNIRNCYDDGTDSWVEYLEATMNHEINHLRQCICECRKEQGEVKKSISYQDDGVCFTIESSAESALYNLEINPYYYKWEEYDYTYPQERSQENILFLLALLEGRDSIEGYYNAIFDTDIHDLLDYFNLTSKEEIFAFYRYLYVTDAKWYRNDFIKKYYGVDIPEELTVNDVSHLLGFGKNVDIFKLCLNKLINKTETEELPLEENLLLFAMTRNLLISKSTLYNFETKETSDILKEEETEEDLSYTTSYSPSFVSDFMKLEESYVAYVCAKYNIQEEEFRLKVEELEWNFLDLSSYAEKDFDSYYSDFMFCKEFMEKYPIAQTIFYTDYIPIGEYEDMLESYGEVKTLSKSLSE